MNKVDILLGLQWGDEGKGKIVDLLTKNYDAIARFQGGPNAGHTLEFDNIKHVLHTIPSGIFNDNIINIVGNGVVIDPVIFKQEIDALYKLGIDVTKRLIISKKAHIILPTHGLIDHITELSKGKEKIGSTLKGIGPAYMDKTGRNGFRVGDLFSLNWKNKYSTLVQKHIKILNNFQEFQYDLAPLEDKFFASMKILRKMKIVDTEFLINALINNNKRILAEGAQGTMLDVDFGSYPYVTSSTTTSAGACTGLGIPPNRIGEVYGIFKAYCTRVGSGPFPTELNNEDGQKLSKAGNEFGSTTGRARRCGWLDLPALKYAIMINGVTKLIMMKSDVLDDFETIRVCEKYNINNKFYYSMPYDISSKKVWPYYKELEGWKQDLTNITKKANLPNNFKIYVDYLEKELNVPITFISVGPDRKQTIIC